MVEVYDRFVRSTFEGRLTFFGGLQPRYSQDEVVGRYLYAWTCEAADTTSDPNSLIRCQKWTKARPAGAGSGEIPAKKFAAGSRQSGSVQG